jgi:hypothetical protein
MLLDWSYIKGNKTLSSPLSGISNIKKPAEISTTWNIQSFSFPP